MGNCLVKVTSRVSRPNPPTARPFLPGTPISSTPSAARSWKDSVTASLDDRGDRADIQLPVLYFYNLERQKKDKGYFYNFVGLDVHERLPHYAFPGSL